MNDECASPRPDCRKTQQGQVNPTASKTTQISQTQNTRKARACSADDNNCVLPVSAAQLCWCQKK
jgi:hypothetical protein